LPSMLLTLERIIISRNFEEPLMQIYDDQEDTNLGKQNETKGQKNRKERVEACNN
jgi:hypothetical protein